MSENSIFNHFEQKGSATKTGAKWGLTLGGVTLTDLSVTWGLQGKANMGLSTALYVSPPAVVVGATGLLSMAVGIFAAMKMGTAAAWTGIKAVTAAVAAPLLKFPAYVTMEIGSKWDCIVGYKKDYITHIASKTVGGEWGECYGDKIEYYHANLYKYVSGTEYKIELKGKEAKLPNTLTRSQLISNYTTYAENYEKYLSYQKTIASKDASSEASGNNTVSAGTTLALNGNKVNMTAGDEMEITATKNLGLGATQDLLLWSFAGSITLQCGVSEGVVISASETKINNKLSLGMPGIGAPVDVASKLAAYQAEIAQLQIELNAAKTKAAGAKAEFSARLLAAMAV